MSVLPQFEPRGPIAGWLRLFVQWVRALRRILTVGEEGIRWADNVGPVVTYDHLGDDLPIRVRVPVTDEPLSLCVLRVVTRDQGDGFRSSWNRIGWYWRGGEIEITSLDDVNSSTFYRVTLGLLMG